MLKMVHIKKKASRKKTKLVSLGSLNTVNLTFLYAILSLFSETRPRAFTSFLSISVPSALS